MKEFININGTKYEVQVNMGLDRMLIQMPAGITADTAANMFKDMKEINIIDEENNVFGAYPYVEYNAVTTSADDTVTISMKILTKTEQDIADLQKSSEQQRADIDFIASMNNIEL